MAEYSSNTQRKLKVGINSFSENTTSLQVVGNVGIGTTNAQDFDLYVQGDARITGLLSATSYSGDGSGLSGILRIGQQAPLTTPVFVTLASNAGVNTVGIATTASVSFAFIPSTGNVGIGSTLPTSKLTVNGNALVTGITTTATLNATLGDITNLTGTAVTYTTARIISGFTTNLTGIALTYTTGTITNGFFTNITGTALTYTTAGVTNGTITNLTGTAQTYTNSVITNGSVTNLTGTAVTYTIGNITNLTGTNISYSGIGTFLNGPILIGSATQTGTAFQRLQVTGGGYFSSNVGFGTTNPQNQLQVNSGTAIGFIDGAGNLGLGTPTATSKIHVVGNILIVGIETVTTLNATTGIVTNFTGVALTSTLGNITNLSGIGLSYSGISTIANLVGTALSFSSPGFSTITNLVGTAISYSGIGTFLNGPILIGSATSTGTALQRLQVTGGAFFSGNVGIATTNPLNILQVGSGSTIVLIDNLGDLGIGTATATSKLHVVGDALIAGIVTATGGFNIGIQSAGLNIATGVVTAINFVGSGNSISYISTTRTVNVSISGGGGGGSFAPVNFIIGGY